MAIDIHDRKVAEVALRESEKRYRDLLETIYEGFRVIDEKGFVTYANQKLGEMLGYQPDEIIGRPATSNISVSRLRNSMSPASSVKAKPQERLGIS